MHCRYLTKLMFS